MFKALAEARKRPDTPCCYLRFSGRYSLRVVAARQRAVVSCGVHSVRFLSMVACLGSPVSVPVGPYMLGGGLVGAPFGARLIRVMSGCPFRVSVGGNGRWLLQRCFVVRPDEVRVNLVTPLWCRPHRSDMAPDVPTSGESASGSPCHYLRCGSDRAGSQPRPWWPCNSCYGQ